MQVVWTPQAEKDLEAIEDYFLKVAPDFTEIIVDEIQSRVKQLENFPQIGRMVPDIYDHNIREILYRNYRIVYYLPETETDPIEIITVFHSSKQFGEI
ncbi:MAG: type II toxin-antitoxin system RelE/ParE family toxin [Balneolaceae bacterium]|nr:type II toxin-antitoxin system RelE/ParE family toxin [Balneolaceae bacterium]